MKFHSSTRHEARGLGGFFCVCLCRIPPGCGCFSFSYSLLLSFMFFNHLLLRSLVFYECLDKLYLRGIDKEIQVRKSDIQLYFLFLGKVKLSLKVSSLKHMFHLTVLNMIFYLDTLKFDGLFIQN